MRSRYAGESRRWAQTWCLWRSSQATAAHSVEAFVSPHGCPDLFLMQYSTLLCLRCLLPGSWANSFSGKGVSHRQIHVIYCKNNHQSLWNKCEKKQLVFKNWIANLAALQSYKYTNLITHLLSYYIKVIHEDTENSALSAEAKREKLPGNSLLCLLLVLLKLQLTFISKTL